MNNKYLRRLLVLLPVLSLLLSSCNKMPQQDQTRYPVVSESAILLRSGSGFEFQNTELNQDCLVGEKDLQAYLNYKRLIDESTWPDGEITPILNNTGDVVMYAINYPEGWELIAADKRCSAVLASDRNGHFVFEEQIPPVQTWLTCTGEDVLNVRAITSYDEIKEPEVVEKMQSNENFWKMITADKEYLNERMKTRLGPDPEGFDDGEWLVTNVVWDTLSYQLVDHLVQTHWNQHFPYNYYSPRKSYAYYERTSAGCVPVAVGQVVNYFHNETGFPATAPLTAFCDAQVPGPAPYYYSPACNDSHMYVADLSASAWDSIPSSGKMIARLLAEIGISVHLQYRDDGAFMNSYTLDPIKDSFFINKGFMCVTGSFYTNGLVNNITSGKPVIADASISDNPNYSHTFIIDAYECYYEKITTYYVWVPRIPEPGDPPTTYDEMYYSDEKISMNWGWGPSYDSAWYRTFENWSVAGYTFSSSNRHMLYNISIQP